MAGRDVTSDKNDTLMDSSIFHAFTNNDDRMTTSLFENDSKDIDDFLNKQSLELMSVLTPYLVYLAVLMVCGLVGNGTVLVVYYYRFKPSNPRIFILIMSLCDLIINVWGLLYETFKIRFAYNFQAAWACKMFAVVLTVLINFSAFVLVAVAVERQRLVCGSYARAQHVDRFVYIALTLGISAGVALSLPRSVLYGRSTVIVPGTNITGVMCNIQDQYLHSTFRIVYINILGLLFVLCVVTVIVCYMRIGFRLLQHKKRARESSTNEKPSTGSDTPLSQKNRRNTSGMENGISLDGKGILASRDAEDMPADQNRSTTPPSLSCDSVPDVLQEEEKPKEAMKVKLSIMSTGTRDTRTGSRFRTRTGSLGQPIPSRTTLMLFVLTVCFIINFVPYLVMECMRSLAKGSFLQDMDTNLLLLSSRSFYLNSVINPFVYSFCSAKFRNECLRMGRSLQRRWSGKRIITI